MSAKACCVSAIFILLSVVAAQAQSSGNNTGAGGTASTGTGVRTGQGPLSQPIPPATSLINPQQNYLRSASPYPRNYYGPAQTYPSPEPFGTPYRN